ncbi:restriction endonuclease subunit S [Methanosarcina sp. T3]|uniref:restriction endonuclease subunit S n=1 Tax=Methanosarcina sp. T3 TaxID=3439062 RepID=UPI003F874979
MKTIKSLTEAEISELPKLPEGWVWIRLDSVGELFCGQSPSIAEVNQEKRGVPYVTGPEQWDGSKIKETKWTEFPKRLVPEGCIFITVKGAGVGKIFPGVSCAIGRDIYAFLPSSKVDFKYTLHAIKHQIDVLIMKAQGDIPGLSKNHILDHVIGLCSLEEQRAIVFKIEQLFSELDNGIANLKLAQEQLKVYRQAVLKKAFEGMLTRDSIMMTQKRIGDFAELITKGASPKWQGFNYVNDESQLLFITSENVRKGFIDLTKKKFLPLGFNEKQKRSTLKKGDVLFNLVGASIGRAAIFNQEVLSNINQAVAIIRLTDDLNNSYLTYFLNAEIAKQDYLSKVVDVARANLSLADVNNLTIPYCSLPEQQTIVQEIETRLSVCDKIEQDIETNLETAKALRQSILKKAFEGKLLNERELAEVFGAEDWEPAEVLLERVKSERARK